MSDYFTFVPFISAVLFVIGSVGLLSAWASGRRHGASSARRNPSSHPSDWRPSGKIDFVAPKVPKDARQSATFVLKVEEYCVFQSPAGAKHVKVRWRDASLAEAKQVASRHNAVGIIFENELPFVTRAPKLVSDLSLTHSGDQSDSPSSLPVSGMRREGQTASLRR